MKKRGGYNRLNFLDKVKAINEIYLQYAKKGYPAEFIYQNYVREQYYISRTTFFNYLTIPYKQQKEEELNKIKHRQLQIDFLL